MHTPHSSTLLPDLFRHKDTKVRVLRPKALLLDFHGTISERRWEDKVIFPYVKQAVGKYLRTHWFDDDIQQSFTGLKNESFEQRFRNKFEDAPIISDVTPDGVELEPDQLATQMNDFLVWQMNNRKETKDTQLIERLVWRDGLKKHQIKVPIFDEVMSCLQTWHTVNKCKIYVTSSLEEDTLKLLFENTDKGDLSKFIDGYYSSKKQGDKLMGEIYARLYEDLKKAKQIVESPEVQKTQRKHDSSSHNANKGTISPIGSESSADDSSSSSGILQKPKPILFITDSGQEAKAAGHIADGHAYECLLITRPGNRKIRTYYLSRFSFIERFTDIQFV